jgi:hypothetical protein
MDAPENYLQDEFHGNIATIIPLLENLRSLYIVLRRWGKYVWNVQLGSYFPEHAPPSLQLLSIQVNGYFMQHVLHTRVLTPFIRYQLEILLLKCSLVKVLFGGGNGLRHGSISTQPSSPAKICDGGDQLKLQPPRH